MAAAFPTLTDIFPVFQTDAWLTLPGLGEFNPEPETGPIAVVFLSAPVAPVPRQLDAQTYERWDWLVALRRADAPDLRHGAVLRAAAPGETVAARWFVDEVEQTHGDEIRALLKLMPEEA